MRLILTAAVASLAIATAACNSKSDDAEVTDMAGDPTANEMAMADDMNMAGNDNMAAPMAAAAFAATIAGSDMYEIEAGKLAQSMATMEECRKFGGMLVADHGKSSADLKAAAAAAMPAITLPTTMPPEHQAKLDALKAAKGAAFDKLFIEQQKEAHQKALAALTSYASSGDSPPLKEFAGKAAPVVKAHLDMLNSMKI